MEEEKLSKVPHIKASESRNKEKLPCEGDPHDSTHANEIGRPDLDCSHIPACCKDNESIPTTVNPDEEESYVEARSFEYSPDPP